MENTSSADVAKWVETLSGTVIPVKQRSALHDFIVQRDINGRAFSMILNEHALADFNLPDLSLAMATKVRKCWHADFPASVGIKPEGSVRNDDQSQRYDPCQDGADYAGYEGYAGFKPGPSTGRSMASQALRNVGRPTTAPARSEIGQRSAHLTVGRQPTSGQRSASANGPKQVTITLEVMRAALDCVAERADLNRQDMYLWLNDAIPDEVWQPLWASYTSDLVRERHNEAESSMDPIRARQMSQKSRQATSPNPVSASHTYDFRSNSPPIRPRGHQVSAPQEMGPEDELAQLPELRSRLEGHRSGKLEWEEFRQPAVQQDPQLDDDLHSQAGTLRSEAEAMSNDAMSHWLGDTMVKGATLSPFELANWLRMLPKDRLESDTLKAVARHVLDQNMDEEEFGTVIASRGLASFGVSDARQAQILERYFKQRQSEAAMAEAAKQSGALNRQFNAKLEATAKQAWSPQR